MKYSFFYRKPAIYLRILLYAVNLKTFFQTFLLIFFRFHNLFSSIIQNQAETFQQKNCNQIQAEEPADYSLKKFVFLTFQN